LFCTTWRKKLFLILKRGKVHLNSSLLLLFLLVAYSFSRLIFSPLYCPFSYSFIFYLILYLFSSFSSSFPPFTIDNMTAASSALNVRFSFKFSICQVPSSNPYTKIVAIDMFLFSPLRTILKLLYLPPDHPSLHFQISYIIFFIFCPYNHSLVVSLNYPPTSIFSFLNIHYFLWWGC
jgi:hypothetical protein